MKENENKKDVKRKKKKEAWWKRNEEKKCDEREIKERRRKGNTRNGIVFSWKFCFLVYALRVWNSQNLSVESHSCCLHFSLHLFGHYQAFTADWYYNIPVFVFLFHITSYNLSKVYFAKLISVRISVPHFHSSVEIPDRYLKFCTFLMPFSSICSQLPLLFILLTTGLSIFLQLMVSLFTFFSLPCLRGLVVFFQCLPSTQRHLQFLYC